MDSELIVSNNSVIPQTNEIISIEATVKQAEKYIESLNKIRLMAIKVTNTMDWSSQGDKPYLEKSGCDKIAGAFGVKIFNPEFVKENCSDEIGDYIVYTCSAHGVWNNHEESEIGTCSTRDDFFGKRGGQYKPLSEVDITDIKKKSFTNMANRLIKKLLGLSFTWEEIEELSGGKIKKSTVQKVEFGKGSKGGNTDSPETKNNRDEIRRLLLLLNDNNEQAASKMLEAMTTFKSAEGNIVKGKTRVQYLTEKQIPRVLSDLKKEIDDFNKQLGE